MASDQSVAADFPSGVYPVFTNFWWDHVMYQSPHFPGPPLVNQTWCDAIFSAKAVERGGIVRRSRRDVDREIGRDTFIAEVRQRGFHLVEVGGQYVVICNAGHMNVIC